ncbi:hypothetical protein D6825_01045 [Candidatus Woesearchaeota archaeon]|nr:MAG: hypothetical protein D6825_01045 [Candidatus Woesearchaeota archaeon]
MGLDNITGLLKQTGKTIALIALLTLTIDVLAYFLAPTWLFVILIVSQIIGVIALVALLVLFGPEILSFAAEAAEVGAAASTAGGETAALQGIAKSAASAERGTALQEQKTKQPFPTSFLAKGILIVIVVASLLAVMKNLGISTSISTFAALGIGALITFYFIAPSAAGTLIKPLGISAILILIFFLLTMFGFHPLIILAIIATGTILAYANEGAGKGTLTLAITLSTIILFMNFYPELISQDALLYKTLETQSSRWGFLQTSAFKKIPSISPKDIASKARRQVLITAGLYEEGVEAESKKPLGVFLENPGVASPKVPETGKISAYATLRAESSLDELNIDVDCKIGDVEGKITPQKNFTIQGSEYREINCVFDASQVGAGRHAIELSTTFDFTTSAFLKSYFMRQDKIRAYRREGEDPLEAFGIEDKNPVAIFTGGPVRIGMGVPQQPIAISEDSDFGPTLQITLDKNWPRGKLTQAKSIEVTLPQGLIALSVNGYPLPQGSCNKKSENEYTCNLDENFLKQIFPEGIDIQTIRIETGLVNSESLFQNHALAIHSFKVTFKYRYKVSQTLQVEVTKAGGQA